VRFWDEISQRLAGLSGTASPDEARQALNEFDVRDIQAVRVSEGGGGGGSYTGGWVGPYAFTFEDYNADLGSGWDGVLIDVATADLPVGSFVTGSALQIVSSWDNATGVTVYVGTLAGQDYGIGTANLQNAPGQGLFGVVLPAATSAAAVLIDNTITQVWIDDFDGQPMQGEALLWVKIETPTAPS